MYKKFVLALLLGVLTFNFVPAYPVHSANMLQSSSQAAVQGEVAYVLNGDIWLLDLFTGKTQQLTTNGNNQLPNWSSDGRYLFYSHGVELEQSDVYILEPGQGEPELLVEDACCAGWEPSSNRIAYIALNEDKLSIEAMRADGSNRETLYSPLTYGGGVYPNGKLSLFPIPSENEILVSVPVELIGANDENTPILAPAILHIELMGGNIQTTKTRGECLIPSFDMISNEADGRYVVAIAFLEGNVPCTQVNDKVTDPRGVEFSRYIGSDEYLRELPWLAYPTLSPDGYYLVAERFIESNDPASSALWGIVLYNSLTDNQLDLIEGASQPAWRPLSPTGPVLPHYDPSDQQYIAIDPPLTYDGATYQIHYLSTGDYTRTDADLFSLATPALFESRGITALVVTRNDEVVHDEATLRHIFQLYAAAYYLYHGELPIGELPSLAEELQKILENNLIRAMELDQLLRRPESQYTEVLRAMLTDSKQASSQMESLYNQAFQETPKRVEDALGAFRVVLKDQQSQLLKEISEELSSSYQKLDTNTAWNQYQLKLMRLLFSMLFTSHLQEARANWLQTYINTFSDDVGGLERSQLRGVQTVLIEAESDAAQRAGIAIDFASDEVIGELINKAGDVAPPVVARLAEKFGYQLSTHALSSALGAVSVGVSLNSILYGIDALLENFTLAQRAEELRTVFQIKRQFVQKQVTTTEPVTYDGNLVEQFWVAHLLESLASITAQHYYADGIIANQSIPNPVTFLNKVRGQNWQTAAEGLHQNADEMETTLLNKFASPLYLDAAILLSKVENSGLPTDKVGSPEPLNMQNFLETPLKELILRQGELVYRTQRGNGFSNWSEVHTLWTEPETIFIPALRLDDVKELELYLSPNAQQVVYVDEQLNKQVVGLMDAAGTNRHELFKTAHNITEFSINWSPDSRKIAIADKEAQTVVIFDLESTNFETVWRGDVEDVIFAPNGKELLISYWDWKADDKGILIRYDPDSGMETRIAKVPVAIEEMTWQPNGQKLIFTYKSGYSDDESTTEGIWMINPDGSNLERLVSGEAHTPVWAPDGSFLLFNQSGLLSAVTLDHRVQHLDHIDLGGGASVVWWSKTTTPAVQARIQLNEEGKKNRTIPLNWQHSLNGVEFHLQEIKIQDGKMNLYMSLTNLGDQGRIYLSNMSATAHIFNPEQIQSIQQAEDRIYTINGEPIYKLVPSIEFPSTLPVGASWEGWFELETPIPLEAVGATLQLNGIGVEKPTNTGAVDFWWTSAFDREEDWYLPLR